jgi:6-phosphogluconolactonase (cycloisomerase 2 family)
MKSRLCATLSLLVVVSLAASKSSLASDFAQATGVMSDPVPTVEVMSPRNDGTGYSPVPFRAHAMSPTCDKGIAAIRIYTAPGVNAYTVKSDDLNTTLSLAPGTYNTVVQAWDNCGAVGKTPVTITVTDKGGSHHLLYAMEGNGISGWILNALTGVLTPTGQEVVPAHGEPYRGASDPSGTHLYVANVSTNDVSAYTIDHATGYLKEVPGSPYDVGRVATAVAVHPSGKFVYMTRSNATEGDGIAAFSVNPDGSLTTIPGSPFSTQISPDSLLVDSTGKYLYVADDEFEGAIDGFSIDGTSGALTPIAGSPFVVPPVPGCAATFSSDIVEDVTGSHLYTSDSYDNAISGFSIDLKTGVLTPVPGSPFPNYSCIDPMVNFNPDTLTVVPNGKFLFAANGIAQTISSYSIDHASGAIHLMGESAQCFDGVTTGPIIRSDPSGRFLYSVGVAGPGCGGSKAIIAIAVDTTSGALKTVKGSPFLDANPTGPVSGAIVMVP